MLNRKYADLRHAPELDPRLLSYDPQARPQAVVRLGPASREKAKGGVRIGAPGFTWALFWDPGRWYALTAVYDARGRLLVHQVDLCVPSTQEDGIVTFLDLKLDLLIFPAGEALWVDQDEYEAEVRAGTIPPAWQAAVETTVRALEAARAAGAFPPAEVTGYRPPSA